MLTIELDSLDQSLRKRIALKKCPVLKRRFWLLVAAIVLLTLVFIAWRDIGITQQLLQSVVAITLIPFLAWALFHTPLAAIGSSTEAYAVLSGNTHLLTYTVTDHALVENTPGIEKQYLFKDYVRIEQDTGTSLLVFQEALVYIPAGAIRAGSTASLLTELKKQLANQGSSDAVTGAQT
jgi:hypothetical protein